MPSTSKTICPVWASRFPIWPLTQTELFQTPKHGTFPTAIGFFPAILASFLRNARRGSMTDQPGVTKDGVCRRSLLKSAPMIVGAIISTTAIPDTLFAQTKLSHEASKYQDQPKDGQQCSTCVQFEPPSACKTVESPISPNGWCQLYVAKPGVRSARHPR